MSAVDGPRETAIPDALGPVADLAGILTDDGRPAWLVLSGNGALRRWIPDRADVETITVLPLPKPEPDAGDRLCHRLHVSRCGRFAAVVEDYGNRGAVLDLSRGGAVTMELSGGDYHEDVVPFSLLFAEHEGAAVMVHRTAWNRLDVSDPATGRLLTPRESPDPEHGDAPHYLDYFHGALYPSPDGTRIYDDGWVWQPLGVPAVWSLTAWMRDDPFESEDGASRTDYAFLEEWGRGVAWIRADRIAVFDSGDGGQPPCVRVLDPTQLSSSPYVTSQVMKTVTTFPGPDGRYFTDRHGDAAALLLASAETGLEAWDIDAGSKTFELPGFRPDRQHQHTLELIELGDRVVRCWQPRA